jgi:hypothetical protein
MLSAVLPLSVLSSIRAGLPILLMGERGLSLLPDMGVGEECRWGTGEVKEVLLGLLSRYSRFWATLVVVCVAAACTLLVLG